MPHPFSDPSGTNTPSEFRYSRNESSNGFMIVDLMLICLNLGYHDENWKARTESGVEMGNAACPSVALGIPAWETNREFLFIPPCPIFGCMPLNSHSYLVAQGWQGTGKALREGAASRPVIIAQRRNLAGVGRDRDEAFPFWDQ